MTKINPLTNLPEVPEDYFWRIGNVHETAYGDTTWRVFGIALMRNGVSRFRKRPIEIFVDSRYSNSQPSQLVSAATEMLNLLNERNRSVEISGDYPPRSL